MIAQLLARIPPWLKEWARTYLAGAFSGVVADLLRVMIRGSVDALLLLAISLIAVAGSEALWSSRYTLAPAQQEQVSTWAPVSVAVARVEDVPPVTPLVLWYKEASLRTVNPDNCEGIMGLHSAVASGQLPCFTPGPIAPAEVARQLQLGARAFKQHCPEVHFDSVDPRLLKRCYLYYNAGPNVRLDPDRSGYVMNGYDAAHQNMVHRSASGKMVRLEALGAWPVHLATQAQLASPSFVSARPVLLSSGLALQEVWDRLWVLRKDLTPALSQSVLLPRCREPVAQACFIRPHEGGDARLRPALAPLVSPLARAGELTCDLTPGMDLGTAGASIVVAPLPGELVRYVDQWGHLTVLVENEEWIVWLSGLRSCTVSPGRVRRGQPIGAIGGAGSAHAVVRYAVFDKMGAGFVDPASLMPEGSCPSSQFDQPISDHQLLKEATSMDILELLKFTPLLLGLSLVIWLIFKKDVLAKGPLQVAMYFVGVLIVLLIVGWLVDVVLPWWVVQRLETAQQSEDIQQIEQLSREILNSTMNPTPSPAPVFVATAAPPAPPPPTPTPIPAPPSTPVAPQPTQQLDASTSFGPANQPLAGEQLYRVSDQDTLFRISQRFGVSMAAIQERNNLADPNDIRIGQELIIPAP